MADARDKEIESLERRIYERRMLLRDSLDELNQAALATRQRIRERATSPVVWGTALALGFVAARFAGRRRRDEPRMRRFHEPPVSATRQVLGAILSAALPIALRVARYSAQPWIARMLQQARASWMRRHAYARAYDHP